MFHFFLNMVTLYSGGGGGKSPLPLDIFASFIPYIQKGGFQICPRMDFDNILYVEYLRYNNYKNEIISFLEGC